MSPMNRKIVVFLKRMFMYYCVKGCAVFSYNFKCIVNDLVYRK